jgi:hypothetical protein
MLNDLEARLIGRRPGRFGRAFQVLSVYLLIALALLAELELVLLHPEDDPIMLIGIILLTIALAIWLRFLFLVPAVILLWLVPPSVRDAVTREDPFTWGHAAALAGQLYLAGATRFIYKALKARLLMPAEPLRQPVSASGGEDEAVERQEAFAEFVNAKPALPCGRVLAPAEAATFLDRLLGLDRELRASGESIRSLLENGLVLEPGYPATQHISDRDHAGAR